MEHLTPALHWYIIVMWLQAVVGHDHARSRSSDNHLDARLSHGYAWSRRPRTQHRGYRYAWFRETSYIFRSLVRSSDINNSRRTLIREYQTLIRYQNRESQSLETKQVCKHTLDALQFALTAFCFECWDHQTPPRNTNKLVSTSALRDLTS